MPKARIETISVVHEIISRRMFCESDVAALTAQLLPGMTFGIAMDSAAMPSSASDHRR